MELAEQIKEKTSARLADYHLATQRETDSEGRQRH